MSQNRKCAFCDKRAMAYRLEGDGSKLYLCPDHIPGGEEELTRRPKLRLVPLSQPKPDSAKPD